jgi:hypothetical protein
VKIPKIEIDEAKWNEAVAHLEAMTWSRQQCADYLGIAYATFLDRLRYAGLADKLKHTRRNLGANNARYKENPELFQRYQDAVAYALKVFSVKKSADKFGVNYQVLSRKVRAAKAELGEDSSAADCPPA